MKLLLDFFPIILFFIVFKWHGIYAATAVAIIASIAQLLVTYIAARKIEPMLWISLAVIVLFGGSTLLFHNEIFIKWKPTILYWVFAAAIITAKTAFNKNIVHGMMHKQMSLPDHIWRRLNMSWMLFFALLGGLNLMVAYRFSTSTWVSFKLFGILGLIILFALSQGLFLSPYLNKEEKPSGD